MTEAPLSEAEATDLAQVLAARAGLLTGGREGRWTWWTVVPERLAAVRRALGA